MMGKKVVVVQARMGSERLPNKMMLWCNGYPIAGWIVERCMKAKKVDDVVFAIPDKSADDVLARYVESKGVSVVRGSESDVLGRICKAAEQVRGTTIIRVCGDNPYICPEAIDSLIAYQEKNGIDYAFNHIPKGNLYPNGLGAEAVHIKTLRLLDNLATQASHREHVFDYIWENDGFSKGTFSPMDPSLRHPELELDVDTESDYAWLLRMNVDITASGSDIVKRALELERRG